MFEENQTRWGVVATIRGETEQILQFVNYYLNLGTSYLVLYFDDPLSPAIDLLKDESLIRCIPCTDEHWKSMCLKDPHLDEKILGNMSQGRKILNEMDIEWAICVDLDELIHAYDDNETVASALSCVREETNVVTASSLEAILTADRHRRGIFSPVWFKVQPPNRNFFTILLYRIAYFNILNVINDGFFLSHKKGKSFFRTKFILSSEGNHHRPKFIGAETNSLISNKIGLLHFDSMDYDSWKLKWDWRIGYGDRYINYMTKKRRKQLHLIRDAMKIGENALKGIYRRWFYFDERRLFFLKHFSMVRYINIDNSLFDGRINMNKFVK